MRKLHVESLSKIEFLSDTQIHGQVTALPDAPDSKEVATKKRYASKVRVALTTKPSQCGHGILAVQLPSLSFAAVSAVF